MPRTATSASAVVGPAGRAPGRSWRCPRRRNSPWWESYRAPLWLSRLWAAILRARAALQPGVCEVVHTVRCRGCRGGPDEDRTQAVGGAAARARGAASASPADDGGAQHVTSPGPAPCAPTPPMLSIAVRPTRHSYLPAGQRRASSWSTSRAPSSSSEVDLRRRAVRGRARQVRGARPSRRCRRTASRPPLIEECPINMECAGAPPALAGRARPVHRRDRGRALRRGRARRARPGEDRQARARSPTWRASTGRWASKPGQLRLHAKEPREDGRLSVDALLHHHSHLLRERRAPPGPRLHHHRRRRAGALPPPAGRRRLLPHRHRRARQQGGAGRRGARPHAAAARRRAGAALPRAGRGRWAPPTTSSSARPTPEHEAFVQRFVEKLRAAGDIEKRTYGGLYCTACEAFYYERDLVDGRCPIHGTEPVWLEEENYYFLLSALPGPAGRVLSRQPGVREAAARATTRRCRSSSRASTTSASAAPASPGACPCPGTPSRSSTSGSTPSSTTCRRSPTRAPVRTSWRASGRRSCTSWPRTSSSSTPSSGRRCS